MLNLKKFINTDSGRKIMSIILGIGLASLFRKSCQGRNCIVFKPPPKEDADKVYKYNGKCFKYEPHNIKCSSNKKTINFS